MIPDSISLSAIQHRSRKRSLKPTMVVFLLMMLLLVTGTLAWEDLEGKVFFFPKQTSTAHVILHTETQKTLQQLSICLRSFTELTRNYALFSLATPSDDNSFVIYSVPPNHFHLNINQEQNNIRIDPEALEWKHTCVTWDSVTGLTQLWINGKFYLRRVMKKGFTIGAQTSIILGQEQDSYGGGFDINESFVGEMSDVHMWDRVLTPEEIKVVMYGDLQGNLINWKSLNYHIKGDVLVVPKFQ